VRRFLGIGRRASEEPPTRAASSPPTRGPENLSGANLTRFLREHSRAVVDVWAPWCGPCRQFTPIFAASAVRWGGAVGFGKIHADHSPSLVARFSVRSIPTLLFFRDGGLVRSSSGISSVDELDAQIRKVFRDLP
jgi:thioredoxin